MLYSFYRFYVKICYSNIITVRSTFQIAYQNIIVCLHNVCVLIPEEPHYKYLKQIRVPTIQIIQNFEQKKRIFIKFC